MNENLIGYVLNGLDPETQRQVEKQLRTDPTTQHRVNLLRRAVQPLDWDRPGDEPPNGLWISTLATIAEYRCKKLPQAPSVSSSQKATPRRSWRRLDILVAACLVLVVGLLIPPAILKFRYKHQQSECCDTLRQLGGAFAGFHDNHNSYPNPAEEKEPYNVAGFSLPILREAGFAQNVDLTCPSQGEKVSWNMTASELKALSPDEFQQRAPHLLGCYGYSLGYRGESRVLTADVGSGPVPLFSDRPPGEAVLSGDLTTNSLNHRGRGQNVLFTDGHVEFLSRRTFRDDDMFLNRVGKQEPGVNRFDGVIAPSETRVEY